MPGRTAERSRLRRWRESGADGIGFDGGGFRRDASGLAASTGGLYRNRDGFDGGTVADFRPTVAASDARAATGTARTFSGIVAESSRPFRFRRCGTGGKRHLARVSRRPRGFAALDRREAIRRDSRRIRRRRRCQGERLRLQRWRGRGRYRNRDGFDDARADGGTVYQGERSHGGDWRRLPALRPCRWWRGLPANGRGFRCQGERSRPTVAGSGTASTMPGRTLRRFHGVTISANGCECQKMRTHKTAMPKNANA